MSTSAAPPRNRFLWAAWPSPDEVAGAVLYMVSDAVSYTNGACLTVDGGLLCSGLA